MLRRSVLAFRSSDTRVSAFRVLVVGLLGSIAMLIASYPSRSMRAPHAASDDAPRRAADVIVDVSKHLAGDRIYDLLGLAPGERVIEIDARAAGTEEVVAAWRELAAGQFLDLTVAEPSGALHRVLLLAHP